MFQSFLADPAKLKIAKYIIVVLILCLTVLFSYFDRQYEDSIIQERTLDENRYIASIFQSNIRSRLLAMERMASRWITRKGTPRNEWEEDAQYYVDHQPGFQAIEWIDSSFHVRWIVPFKGNESAQDLYIKFEQKRAKAVDKAIENDEVFVSPTIDLVQGGKGFLSYFPLVDENYFDGLIVGVFHIDDLIQSIIKSQSIYDFHIQIFEEHQLIFESRNVDIETKEKWAQHTPIQFYGTTWDIFSWPTQRIIQDQRSYLPLFIVCTGGIFSLTIFIIISLFQQRLRSNMELAESKNQLQHIVETAVDGLLTFDENALIETFNPACERIFCYQKSEIIGKPMFMLLPEALKEHFQFLINRYLTTGEAEFVGQKREVTGRRKTGETFEIEISVSEVSDTHPRLFSVFIRDITERKKVEAEREELINHLKITNENLEQYARAASHDLKEPVRSISNYLEMFNKKYGEDLEDKAKHYISSSIQSAKRMSALIEGLLQYSLIDIRNVEYSQIDLNRVVQSTLDNLNSLIERHQAKIFIDKLPTVKAVEIHMVQLFQNLLLNAIKYKSTAEPRIEIRVQRQDNDWVFSVKDNGVGIAPEYLIQIFQLFKRLHTQDEVSGSGIGLALCKRIITRHKGNIWVESKPGEGSTFFFTLPFTATPI